MIRIPCGRVMGHGESCSDGYLCDSCKALSITRRLIIEFDAGELDITGRTEIGAPWDYEQGKCFWCHEAVSPRQGKLHSPDCAWKLATLALGLFGKEEA
jgi:hypothetical protein